MITATRVRDLFTYDLFTGHFFRNGKKTGYTNARGYRMVTIDGIKYLEHRLVWLWMYGVFPVHVIDHINRMKTDNTIWNLRDVTQKINTSRRLNVGVSFHRKAQKYRAYINIDGQHIHLGLFNTREEAIDKRTQYETQVKRT